jgi:hypothetical protein
MKNLIGYLLFWGCLVGFFDQQAFAGASIKAQKGAYSEVWNLSYNLEHSAKSAEASLDKKEVFKKKRLRKPRPQTNYYDLEKVLTWSMISLSVLGLVGFGLGIGLSLGWLWGIALGIFGMQFLWIFLGFAVPDGEAHMVIVGLILGGLILFGLESIILGLVFSMTWVWIMGIAILVLMLAAFLLFIAVISAAAPRHG